MSFINTNSDAYDGNFDDKKPLVTTAAKSTEGYTIVKNPVVSSE